MGFHCLMRFAARQIGSAAAFFALGRISCFTSIWAASSFARCLAPRLLSTTCLAGQTVCTECGAAGRVAKTLPPRSAEGATTPLRAGAGLIRLFGTFLRCPSRRRLSTANRRSRTTRKKATRTLTATCWYCRDQREPAKTECVIHQCHRERQTGREQKNLIDPIHPLLSAAACLAGLHPTAQAISRDR